MGKGYFFVVYAITVYLLQKKVLEVYANAASSQYYFYEHFDAFMNQFKLISRENPIEAAHLAFESRRLSTTCQSIAPI